MKDKTRLFILKILTACAAFSVLYSSALLLRTLLFGKSAGFIAFLLMPAVFAAGAAAGSLVGKGEFEGKLSGKISRSKVMNVLFFYRKREERERTLTSFVLYLSGIVPVSVTIAAFLHTGIPRTLFEAGFILVVYYLAIKCGLNEAYEIMTSRTALTGLIIFVLIFGTCCYYAPVVFLKPYISIFAYLFLLSYLIVKNQEDIDYNIFLGRYVEKSLIPRDMRAFNLKLVILLFTIILILLNLKFIVILLEQIGSLLLAGLRALFSLFNKGAPAEQVEEVKKQAGGIGFPFIGGGVQRPEHPLLAYIRDVFISTILLYFTCKLIKAVWRYIFKRLLPLLADKLKRLFKPGSREGVETDGDYYDEIEFEKPADEKAFRRHARTKARKARRDLRHITDPAERVRCMYAAVLGLLQSSGLGIAESDTVWEVYAKSSVITEIAAPLNTVSQQYERVRYGSMVPGKGELAEIEKSYSEITAIFLEA